MSGKLHLPLEEIAQIAAMMTPAPAADTNAIALKNKRGWLERRIKHQMVVILRGIPISATGQSPKKESCRWSFNSANPECTTAETWR